MRISIKLWALLGFAVTSFGGTVLHFLYDWAGKTIWVAPISGVNESTWEHIKLFFIPAFLFSIVQSFFLRERKNFWSVKLCSILLGAIMIPVLFYTLNGVFGKTPAWINISIFFISAAISYIFEVKLFNVNKFLFKSQVFAFCTLCVIALLFLLFTFFTPQIEIFRDPVNGGFGIQK